MSAKTIVLKYKPNITVYGQFLNSDAYDDMSYEWVDMFANEINDGAQEAIMSDNIDLAEYLSDNLQNKIQSILLEIDGDSLSPATLKVIITTTDEYSDNDYADLLSYIEGQLSDGWGEGFEQTPVFRVDATIVGNDEAGDYQWAFDSSEVRQLENEYARHYYDEDDNIDITVDSDCLEFYVSYVNSDLLSESQKRNTRHARRI